jgi:hypothetical protein
VLGAYVKLLIFIVFLGFLFIVLPTAPKRFSISGSARSCGNWHRPCEYFKAQTVCQFCNLVFTPPFDKLRVGVHMIFITVLAF